MSSENINFNKVKTLSNKPFLLQHPNHKQKSYGALSQKLHCRRHILFHRQTRRPKITPACRTYRLRVRLIWMCKNNIPLKPSPYACCQTTFTPFGRCRPTMRIIPCAGGWLKPNSPHISLMPKTCPPASRSLHTQATACVATPHTLPVNYAELQNQRVGCVRYARTRLLDWRFAVSTFQTASNAVWKHQLQQS